MPPTDPKEDSSTPPSTVNKPTTWWLIIGPLLTIALGVYALSQMFNDQHEAAIGVGILFVLPACLSAIVSLSMDPLGATKGTRRNAAFTSVITILILGGIIVREGAICIIMLMPLWLIGILLGLQIASAIQTRNRNRNKMQVSVLAVLPFIVLFADVWVPRPISKYQVTRAIIIDAQTDKIWPHLLHMADIEDTEGKWTFSQNVMGIPRPHSALVKSEAGGAIRYARWGDDIRFEEHVTMWKKDYQLHWEFAFPDDSISQYTDRHISPKGAYLDMHDGGYKLVSLPDGKTKLILETNYIVTTPINLYGKIWGEIILGGLQNNILTIVKDRAEK